MKEVAHSEATPRLSHPTCAGMNTIEILTHSGQDQTLQSTWTNSNAPDSTMTNNYVKVQALLIEMVENVVKLKRICANMKVVSSLSTFPI